MIAWLWLAACGPGKPGTVTETDTDASASGTATTGGSTGSSGGAEAPTTGGALVRCADATTEEACALATETDPDLGQGCRWGEVLRFTLLDGGDGCGFEAAGGTCELADFNEGGPGCSGFFRDTEQGVEVVEFGCGSPADDAWQLCTGAEQGTEASAACACFNPGG